MPVGRHSCLGPRDITCEMSDRFYLELEVAAACCGLSLTQSQHILNITKQTEFNKVGGGKWPLL